MQTVTNVTKEPTVLPQASEELIAESKTSFNFYPDSPTHSSSQGCSNSLGSRKSSVCSISSMNSSGSSGSPGHQFQRSLSQVKSHSLCDDDDDDKWRNLWLEYGRERDLCLLLGVPDVGFFIYFHFHRGVHDDGTTFADNRVCCSRRESPFCCVRMFQLRFVWCEFRLRKHLNFGVPTFWVYVFIFLFLFFFFIFCGFIWNTFSTIPPFVSSPANRVIVASAPRQPWHRRSLHTFYLCYDFVTAARASLRHDNLSVSVLSCCMLPAKSDFMFWFCV